MSRGGRRIDQRSCWSADSRHWRSATTATTSSRWRLGTVRPPHWKSMVGSGSPSTNAARSSVRDSSSSVRIGRGAR